MPSVEEFKQSVTEMDEDELDSLLNTTRNERVKREKKSKSSSKSKSKSGSSSSSNDQSLDDLDPDDLTPEQAQAIIDKLQDG